MRPIRNSAKALIVQDGRLLALEMRDAEGEYFILPGGGQEPGETLSDAVRRECREELDADVLVGDLRLIREFIGRNHDEFADRDADFHAIEFMFACALAPGATLRLGAIPDERQVGVAWLPLGEIEARRFYPRALRPILAQLARAGDARGNAPIYLGDIN